jgi:hypothetical protein
MSPRSQYKHIPLRREPHWWVKPSRDDQPENYGTGLELVSGELADGACQSQRVQQGLF